MITKIWDDKCSSGEIFNKHNKGISEPLEKSGYEGNVKYVPPDGAKEKTLTVDKYPNKFWFNPPIT